MTVLNVLVTMVSEQSFFNVSHSENVNSLLEVSPDAIPGMTRETFGSI
jgi:hypothetical protein